MADLQQVISSFPVLRYVGNKDFVSNLHKYDASLAPKSSSHSGDLNHVTWDQAVRGNETPESSNSMIDLSGDCWSYLQCLKYGRWCCELALSGHSLNVAFSPITSNQSNNPRDNILPPPHFKQNMFPYQLCSVCHPSSAAFPMQHKRTAPAPFERREMPMPRGTGQYFLNMNQPLESYRSPFTGWRNQVALRSPKSFSLHANYSSIKPMGITEFGLVENVSGTQASGNSRQQRVSSCFPGTSSSTRQTQLAQSSEHDSTCSKSAYHLNDEDDFPLLSN